MKTVMPKKTLEQSLAASAVAIGLELALISRQQRDLQSKRDKAEARLSDLLDSIEESVRLKARRQKNRVAPFVPATPPSQRSGKEANLQAGGRRAYLASVTETCRKMLIAKGEPMSIGELFAAHPERSRLSRLMLKNAIDARSRYTNPSFTLKKGMAWLPDIPLPPGWTYPEAAIQQSSRRRRQPRDD